MRGEGGEAGEGRCAASDPGQYADKRSPPSIHSQGDLTSSISPQHFLFMTLHCKRNRTSEHLLPHLCSLSYHVSCQVDESSRQREEINGLLSQVCDLQNRVQKYSHENDDLTANLRVYQVKKIILSF